MSQYADAIEANADNLAKIKKKQDQSIPPALLGRGQVWDIRAFPSLASALTAFGDDVVTLYITKQVSVSANTTIPSNVSVVVLKGGSFAISSGVTLTFSVNVLEAGRQTIFTGSGTVAGKLRVSEIPPEWFGAVGDRTTNDYSALQATLDYVGDNYDAGGDGGMPEVILTRSYKCNTGLVVPNRVNIIGNRAHSAGNLNRNTGQLLFNSLEINTKALTIGEDVTLRGIVISGPGEGISGTYGVYGGVDDSEALGVNTQILDCTIEDFETCVALSRWLNTIAGCTIDDAIYGIRLYDRANHTIIRDNRINPGSASPKEAIRIDGTPEGVFIHDNNIEAVYYGVVNTGGTGIVIAHNRFEIANKAFIDVRGTGGASDEDISVDIHHNYLLDYGANASGGNRWGIMVQAGHVTIDDNTIGRYDSGANTGLQYGINFGGTGVIYSITIGKNRIDCYQAFANINDYATRSKVRSRFSRIIDYMWDLADDPGDNVEHYFKVTTPIGYNARYLLRQFQTHNLDDLDASIGEIDIGYRSAGGNNLVAYMDNFVPSATTQHTVTYADDTYFTVAGRTFLELLDTRIYLLRMEPGSAVSGRIFLQLTLDEFQY